MRTTPDRIMVDVVAETSIVTAIGLAHSIVVPSLGPVIDLCRVERCREIGAELLDVQPLFQLACGQASSHGRGP